MSRRRLFIVLPATVTLALTAVPAHGSPRVYGAMKIAKAEIGKVCDGSVRIRRGDVGGMLAIASWAHPKGHADDPKRYRRCSITFRRGPIAWPEFCQTMKHEWRHLAGWRAPPGEAFGRDRMHSNRRSSEMYPRQTFISPACRGPEPRARR